VKNAILLALVVLTAFACQHEEELPKAVYPCGDPPASSCHLLRRPDETVIYDPVYDITWLRDANAAHTLGNYGDGLMTKAEAAAFVQDINTNSHPAGKSDWRLPITFGAPDSGCSEPFNEGYNCTESELGHLYYTELGNQAEDIVASGQFALVNRARFHNIQTDRGYWTDWDIDSLTPYNKVFYFSSGRQISVEFANPAERYYVWLVRDGDTAPFDFTDNGDGTITDNMTGLMWLKDGRYMETIGAGDNGKMSWSEAVDWADNLVFNGYDDWRLPTTLEEDPDCEVGATNAIVVHCLGSEMGYLYWVQGVSSLTPGPFVNVPTRGMYNWSGTAWSEHPDQRAWTFEFYQGQQGTGNITPNIKLNAWPVRDPQP